ncbi:ankyrin [Anaeromyces robustus]|uniref:Ankyrin n=1 Tax=Anaeromyces robustus TaxID=1754192 RepID=A0A1Y1WYD1_9FUNG|nr:ankyrin [Anaeromyces robustus]|eukprot:ORX78206.1 ankyrin [Anaeromyces robustus]
MEACCFNMESKTVQYLIENGAKINEANNNSETAFIYILKYLIENGADVNRMNKNEVVNLLIENGAEINIKGRDGESPLSVAIFIDEEKTESLNNNGANINAQNNKGKTPLLQACKYGIVEAVYYLIDDGADGETPIFRICSYGNGRFIDYFNEHGADFNGINNKGYTPLKIAQLSNNKEAIKNYSPYNHLDTQLVLLILSAGNHDRTIAKFPSSNYLRIEFKDTNLSDNDKNDEIN